MSKDLLYVGTGEKVGELTHLQRDNIYGWSSNV
jgi:hypothetical protein